MADLAMHLPYHAPPEGFRMSSDSSSDADSSMTSSTTTGDERNNSMDRNRNTIPSSLESNANFNASMVKQLTTFNNNLNNQLRNGGDLNKLLKKPPRVPHSTPVHKAKLPETKDEVRFEHEKVFC